jgi:hypothetical protein
MAVTYDVPAGKVFAIAGGASVSVKGTHEHPLIVDNLAELQAAAPSITSLDPSSIEIGTTDIDLIVHGTGFDENSIIVFSNYDEPTTLLPDGTLTTGVKPSLWANPDTVKVAVRNGPAYSASVDFEFTDPAAREAGHRKRRGPHAESAQDQR